jgi:hypothetical protein
VDWGSWISKGRGATVPRDAKNVEHVPVLFLFATLAFHFKRLGSCSFLLSSERNLFLRVLLSPRTEPFAHGNGGQEASQTSRHRSQRRNANEDTDPWHI